jgi:hypothetical protein
MEKQESVLSLCLLHGLAHPANPFHGQESLLAWMRAAMEFWRSAQRPNGSFDEWYPFENSLTATAFSTQCVTECILRTRDAIPCDQGMLHSLEKAASWLASFHEHGVCNQEAGAILALTNVAEITGRGYFLKLAGEKLERLLERQHPEGWFPEYGGADVGYSSVTMAYLAQAWKRGLGGDRLLASLEALAGFLVRFIHPDDSPGGCYGSRNTEYILPLGPELLTRESDQAALLAAHLRRALRARPDIGLLNSDHRYLLFHNYFYLQAWEAGPETLPAPPRGAEAFRLDGAGLVGLAQGDAGVVISLRKGGALKLASPRGGLSDCGWTMSRGDQVWISSHLGPAAGPGDPVESPPPVTDDEVRVDGRLTKVSAQPLRSWLLVGLRLYGLALGRWAVFGRLLKMLARRLLITDATADGPRFQRRVRIAQAGVTIEDSLTGVPADAQLFLGGKTSFAIGPSTRTFRMDELGALPLSLSPPPPGGRLTVRRTYDWEGKLIHMKTAHQ